MSAALNLEAAAARCVLGVLAVCSVCSLCTRAPGCALGRVVAGRFWCSYAWVSLTQTAPVRPRGCVQACAGVCACLCVRARLCAPVCVPLGWLWCCAVVVLWRHPSFLYRWVCWVVAAVAVVHGGAGWVPRHPSLPLSLPLGCAGLCWVPPLAWCLPLFVHISFFVSLCTRSLYRDVL